MIWLSKGPQTRLATLHWLRIECVISHVNLFASNNLLRLSAYLHWDVFEIVFQYSLKPFHLLLLTIWMKGMSTFYSYMITSTLCTLETEILNEVFCKFYQNMGDILVFTDIPTGYCHFLQYLY